MTLITEIRKNVSESTPLLAVVGATDYAVERMRAAAKDASALQGSSSVGCRPWSGCPRSSRSG